MAVSSFLADAARKTPRKTALVVDDRNISYRELDGLVNWFANRSRGGLQDDRDGAIRSTSCGRDVGRKT